MQIGDLTFDSFNGDEHAELVAPNTQRSLREGSYEVFVTQTDAVVADTEAFCERYGVGLYESANCVVVKAKRADRTWYVALMIGATDRADVNKTVKKYVDARKLSFAPMEEATQLTGMEYGGITPIGLPADWQILVEASLVDREKLVIGSGIRGSKLALSGKTLATLPGAEVLAFAI